MNHWQKYIFVTLFILLGNIITTAQNNIDSLEKKAVVASPSEKAKIFNKLSTLTRKTNPAKSVDYALKAADAAKTSGNKKDELTSKINAGLASYFANKMANAQDYFEDALSIIDASTDKEGLINVLDYLGNVYSINGKHDKAVDIQGRLLKNFNENTQKKEYALCINNMGLAYYNWGKYDKALECHTKAAKLFESVGDKRSMAESFESIGNALAYQKKFPQALDYYKKAQAAFESVSFYEGQASVMNHIGLMYSNYGNFDEAIATLNKALQIAESKKLSRLQRVIDDNIQVIKSNKEKKTGSVTQFDKETQQKEKARLQETENLKNAILDEKLKTESQLQLTELEKKQKEEIIAKQKQQYSADSLESSQTISSLNSTVKKTEMELLKEQEQIKRQRIYILFFIVILVVVLAFSFLLWRQFRLKNKAYQQLYKQNLEIASQKEQIENQAKQLEKLSLVASKTNNAIVIMDEQANIEWLNEGFTRIYGYTMDDLYQMGIVNLSKFSQVGNIDDLLQKILIQKKTVAYESPTKTKNGTMLWSHTSITPILDNEGEIFRIIAIDSDISQLKAAEDEIRHKNRELEEKNYVITESINYAKLIQEAILPSMTVITNFFTDSMILYMPRDIVSGDFYWCYQKGDLFYFAVVDCTGHGVPGGFMSMVSYSLLNDVLNDKDYEHPSDILSDLNLKMIKALNKDSEDHNHREDGMDMTLVQINKAKGEIEISLANQIALVHDGKSWMAFDGDYLSIGDILLRREKDFTNYVLKYHENCTLFMYSDGFKDQFSSETKKKFSNDAFEAMIKESHGLPMSEIKQILQSRFNSWKGTEPQTDDVLVVGIKI